MLLRRVPDKILLPEEYWCYEELNGIVQLCEEKNVEIVEYPLKKYKAVGIIKELADV